MVHQAPKHTFVLLGHFIKMYPALSVLVLGSLLVAGIAEVVGVSALLPLLNVVLESDGTSDNILSRFTDTMFGFFGLAASFQNLLVLIVIMISLKAFVTYHAIRIVAFAAADITYDIRVNLMKALMGAKWEYYTTLPLGKLSNAVSTEAETAGHFYTLAGKTFASLIQAMTYTGIAFLLDWKVSLAGIVIGGAAAFCFKFLIKMARESGASYTHSLNSLLARLTESLNGAKPLKAMGQEDRFSELLQKDTKEINAARKKTAVSSLSLKAFQEPMLVVFIAIGLFVMFTYANYPITELLLIAFLFYRLMGHASQVQANYQNTIIFESSVNSILEETKNAQDNVEKMSGSAAPTFETQISFNDVTIGYSDHVVCQNLNDKIVMQRFNVVFGPSGIGKSTLLDSVMGLMPVKGGEIRVDDTGLADIDIQKWRGAIGYVPQETYLFHDTILKNITLGDDTISESDAIQALKLSNAWEFIDEIDDGIHHVVGERGGKLSGGQRQRIALARALARNPKILILDEATTGLDKQSEELILSALKSMASKITVIAVSHDPKILDMADHVIKLQKAV